MGEQKEMVTKSKPVFNNIKKETLLEIIYQDFWAGRQTWLGLSDVLKFCLYSLILVIVSWYPIVSSSAESVIVFPDLIPTVFCRMSAYSPINLLVFILFAIIEVPQEIQGGSDCLCLALFLGHIN